MASLLVFGGMLAYDKVKETRQKRRASKNNSKDFSALEKQNADRIAALQSRTPFCNRSDWSGNGCGSQGREQEQVPSYTESQQSHVREGEGEGGRRRPAPAYESSSSSSSSLVNATANRRNRGQTGQGIEDDETPLVVPDVGHVMPPRYEDVHVNQDGTACKRTLKQKVLRRKGDCGGAAVIR
ncbi:MAG: hypothetical protein Q9174_001947 [Haloplaca sp. 1 TL-2023]